MSLDDPRLQAIADVTIRRFFYSHLGVTHALAPHEIEGMEAEQRWALGQLEQLGDDISDAARTVRDDIRRIVNGREDR